LATVNDAAHSKSVHDSFSRVNRTLTDSGLTDSEIMAWVRMRNENARYQVGKGWFDASFKQLGDAMLCSADRAKHIVTALRKAGYLRLVRRGTGKRNPNRYRFVDPMQDDAARKAHATLDGTTDLDYDVVPAGLTAPSTGAPESPLPAQRGASESPLTGASESPPCIVSVHQSVFPVESEAPGTPALAPLNVPRGHSAHEGQEPPAAPPHPAWGQLGCGSAELAAAFGTGARPVAGTTPRAQHAQDRPPRAALLPSGSDAFDELLLLASAAVPVPAGGGQS
jgi:hypothetical protein